MDVGWKSYFPPRDRSSSKITVRKETAIPGRQQTTLRRDLHYPQVKNTLQNPNNSENDLPKASGIGWGHPRSVANRKIFAKFDELLL
jgi:hypothetical protein